MIEILETLNIYWCDILLESEEGPETILLYFFFNIISTISSIDSTGKVTCNCKLSTILL